MSAKTESRAAALRPYVPDLLACWHGEFPGLREVEGTLLYADVSGFTRLSERLSKRGRSGAEEVVTVISEVWRDLLDAAGDGDPLKFAGDALIVFFDGPDHAARGCTAALAMQEALARRASVRVGRSSVRLRMSIGIDSGIFLMAGVGTRHIDLLILGPAASRTVALEEAAGAGEVLVSGDTAAWVKNRLVSTEERAAGIVIRRMEPFDGPRHAPRPAAGDLARFVPPLLHDLLDSGPVFEHRRATIGFCQVAGVDSILAKKGSDFALTRIQEFVANLMELLAAHGVLLTSCDLGSDGAVFMMSSGAPHAGDGDHEIRMMRVARTVLDDSGALAVRWGINSGHVFAGTVGPPARRAYVTMGDTTNLAARMMAKAEWGEALATAGSVPPSDNRVLVRGVAPFTVKGKRHPVEAVAIEGVAAPRSGDLALPGIFIGRDREVRHLEEAAASALLGRGRVIEITGEQGVGKSRLVAEARMSWTGGSLSLVCDPFERTTPYYAARALLRPFLGIEPDATPGEAGHRLTQLVTSDAPRLLPWLPLLGVVLDASVDETPESSEIDPRFRRVKAQQVAADLGETLATSPTLWSIEDAEHMDDASAELISELLGRIGDRPWLVLITRGPGGQGLHRERGYQASEITLTPLEQEDALELALKMAESRPVPTHLIPEIVERSAGNPLFMAEMLAHSGRELPHSVEDIIAVRIDALATNDRNTLRLLAVLGETFSVDLANRVLSDEGVDTGDDGVWRRLSGFVARSEGRVRFTNPLVRQVAYDGLPYRTRRRIHSRVADALGRKRRDQLPFHLVEAERWEEAWDAARQAADRARDAAANAVAGELYEMALKAARNLDIEDREVSRVAAQCGLMWARAGLPDRALESINLAIATAADPLERLLLEARRASVHEDAGRYPQSLRLLTLALNRLRDEPVEGSQRAAAALHAGYASTRLRQGHHEEAASHASTAVAAAEDAGDKRLQAHGLHLLDRIHATLGDLERAQGYRDAALPLFAEVGDLPAQGTALHDLAADAHRNGRFAEAAWLYQRAADSRSRAGDVIRAAATVNALGEVEMAMGMVDSAEERFADALRVWRGARSPEGVAAAISNLGSVRFEQGRYADAIELLEEAERLTQDIGAPLAGAQLTLAEAFLAEGRFVEAWERATSALVGLDREDFVVRARSVRAATLEATGSFERARREGDQATLPQRAASPVTKEP